MHGNLNVPKDTFFGNRRIDFLEQLSLRFLINQIHKHTSTSTNSIRYFKPVSLCLTFTCAVI